MLRAPCQSGNGGRFFNLIRRLPVEPMLPVFLWLFAWHFPDEPASRLADRLSRLATIGSLALAVILIVANISLIIWPVTERRRPACGRHSRTRPSQACIGR